MRRAWVRDMAGTIAVPISAINVTTTLASMIGRIGIEFRAGE